MGILHEQETSLPLLPMDSPHPGSQYNDPPPYAYTPLSPTASEPSDLSPRAMSPRKSILLPRPSLPDEAPVPMVPVASLGTTLQDPLLQCDAKFAQLIVHKIILPRVRVGVLKWKDRETLEFYPQNQDDVLPRILIPTFPPPECALSSVHSPSPLASHFKSHGPDILEKSPHSPDKGR
jgi:hypothetical protein